MDKDPNHALCAASVRDVTAHEVEGQADELRIEIKSKSTHKQLFSGRLSTKDGRYKEGSMKPFAQSVF